MSIFDKVKRWLGTEAPTNDRSSPEHVEAPADVQADAQATAAAAESELPQEEERKPRSTAPEDALLEREARSLFDADEPTEAIALLSKRGIMFAQHEATSLPCLCRRCLRPEQGTAESSAVAYIRDFVVTNRRVLFYWMPAELTGEARQVRSSMRAELRQRLRLLALTEDRVPTHEHRRRINPFTGKPVS